MKLKLTIIAAALAFGSASFVQAADKADRKVHSADDDRIESEYKAAKAKCDAMQGNQKDICVAEAKGKEKVAKAENDAKTAKDQTRAHARVERVKADAAYDVAKQRCEENKGNEKDVCMKQAKADRDRARAAGAKHERSATTGSSRPEKR
ncbi:MAG TPA: hypothetical protein VM140_12160 [Burkholderiales bacterium]|nr:hypothetical protein [Burkholderiales bacterium]